MMYPWQGESISEIIHKQIPFRLRLAWIVGDVFKLAFIGGVAYVIWHFVSKFW